MRELRSLLCGATLLVTAPLFADTIPAAAVTGFYSGNYSATTVSTRPFVANLLSYCATFADPNLAAQAGYVDQDGNYILLGTTVITDPAIIAVLKAQATAIPGFTAFNIQVYNIVSETGGQEIIFIDTQNRYAVVGGSFNCLVCEMCTPAGPPPNLGFISAKNRKSAPSNRRSVMRPNDPNCSYRDSKFIS